MGSNGCRILDTRPSDAAWLTAGHRDNRQAVKARTFAKAAIAASSSIDRTVE